MPEDTRTAKVYLLWGKGEKGKVMVYVGSTNARNAETRLSEHISSAFNCPSDRAYPAPETYAVYPLLKDYPEKAAVFDVFKEFSYEVSPKGYRRPESYKQAVKEARSYEKKLIQACKDLLGDGCLNKVGGTDEKVSGLRTSLETWVIGAKPGQELLV